MGTRMKGIFDTATTVDGRQKLTTARNKFGHDLDNVHHRYGQDLDGGKITNIYDFFAETKIRVVRHLLPQLTDDKIREIGLKSYKETGDGLLLFTDKAIELGVITDDDAAPFRKNLFHEFHRIGTASLQVLAPRIFTPCQTTNNAFERLRGHVQHGLLTQSCFHNWAEPILRAQEKLDFFEPSALMDFADMGFVTKEQSYEPLAELMRRLNAHPEDMVFIDDSLPNLDKAKELDSRILTVYVCGDLPLDHLPRYIDIQVRRVGDFLNQAADLYMQPQPQTEMNYRR